MVFCHHQADLLPKCHLHFIHYYCIDAHSVYLHELCLLSSQSPGHVLQNECEIKVVGL